MYESAEVFSNMAGWIKSSNTGNKWHESSDCTMVTTCSNFVDQKIDCIIFLLYKN